MKKNTTAILLNLFVMPGSGHIYLGQRFKGYMLAAAALIFLFIPVVKYIMTLLDGLKGLTIEGGQITNSLLMISNAWTINKSLILYCVLLLILIWIYGIVDLVIPRHKNHEL